MLEKAIVNMWLGEVDFSKDLVIHGWTILYIRRCGVFHNPRIFPVYPPLTIFTESSSTTAANQFKLYIWHVSFMARQVAFCEDWPLYAPNWYPLLLYTRYVVLARLAQCAPGPTWEQHNLHAVATNSAHVSWYLYSPRQKSIRWGYGGISICNISNIEAIHRKGIISPTDTGTRTLIVRHSFQTASSNEFLGSITRRIKTTNNVWLPLRIPGVVKRMSKTYWCKTSNFWRTSGERQTSSRRRPSDDMLGIVPSIIYTTFRLQLSRQKKLVHGWHIKVLYWAKESLIWRNSFCTLEDEI